MKKTYNAPEAVEIVMSTKDVITTSASYDVKVEESGDGMCAKW